MSWFKNIETLNVRLRSLSVQDLDGNEIEPNIAFSQWKDHTLNVRARKNTVYLIGNGASASMASHTSADLAKNAHIHTQVFSDLSLITSLANDLSYEEVFAEPLRRRLVEGDMLVAISSSGQSQNILRAVEETRIRRGLVFTLSAMKPDNKLRGQGMLNFYVPADNYGMAETCHAAILHHWIDQIVSDK